MDYTDELLVKDLKIKELEEQVKFLTESRDAWKKFYYDLEKEYRDG